MSPRIGICGITGKLGQEIVDALKPTLPAGGYTRNPDLLTAGMTNDLTKLYELSDVILDVSHPTLTQKICETIPKGKYLVIGTTGLSEAIWDLIAQTAQRVPVLYSANFSVAMTVLTHISGLIARHLPDYMIDITDMHHSDKRDAPSGAAQELARVMASARQWSRQHIKTTLLHDPRDPDTIHIGSHRAGGIPGTHTVYFSSSQEQLTIAHQAFSRRAFAEGAILAAQWIQKQPLGLYSMANVLGMS